MRAMTDRAITNRDNGGPELDGARYSKLKLIRSLLENERLTCRQFTIMSALILLSDDELNARPGGQTLARYARTRKTDPVFADLRVLEEDHGFIIREGRGRGRSNRYSILPTAIIESVARAYEEHIAHKPTPSNGVTAGQTHPLKRGDLPEQVTPTEGVTFNEPTPLEGAPPKTGHPLNGGTGHPVSGGTGHPVSGGRVRTPNRTLQDSLTETLPDGVQDLGGGLTFDGDCFRNPALDDTVKSGCFALSVSAIDALTLGAYPRDRIEQVCKGYALTWSLKGKAVSDPAAYVRRIMLNDKLSDEVNEIKIARARDEARTSSASRRAQASEQWDQIISGTSGGQI